MLLATDQGLEYIESLSYIAANIANAEYKDFRDKRECWCERISIWLAGMALSSLFWLQGQIISKYGTVCFGCSTWKGDRGEILSTGGANPDSEGDSIFSVIEAVIYGILMLISFWSKQWQTQEIAILLKSLNPGYLPWLSSSLITTELIVKSWQTCYNPMKSITTFNFVAVHNSVSNVHIWSQANADAITWKNWKVESVSALIAAGANVRSALTLRRLKGRSNVQWGLVKKILGGVARQRRGALSERISKMGEKSI